MGDGKEAKEHENDGEGHDGISNHISIGFYEWCGDNAGRRVKYIR